MRSVQAKCRVCRSSVLVEVGDLSREAVLERLKKGTFSCTSGQHEEVDPPLNYLVIDWESLADREAVPNDVAWGEKFIAEHGRDNLFYLGDDVTGQALGIPPLHTLRDLVHAGFGDFKSAEAYFVRHDSPRGFRIYVRTPR